MRHLTIFGAGEQLSLNNLLRTEDFRANQFEDFVLGYSEENGLLVLEAEEPTQIHNQEQRMWLTQTALSDYVGTGYLQTAPDTGGVIRPGDTITGTELQYTFYITTPGTCYLWLRGYAPDGGGDSVYVAWMVST